MFALRRIINTPAVVRTFSTQTGEEVVKATVNKAELIERIRNKTLNEKNPLSKVRYEEIANAFFDEISHAVLVEGKEVRIAKFGTFRQKHIAAMQRRNPKTNETFTASPVTKMSFRASTVNKTK